MTYIYDILLNFNDELYEFYDWNKNDKILHVKKIPIYKVDREILNDILNNKVRIKGEFLNSIKDKTEIFYKHEIGKIKYGCLLYSQEKIIALNISEEGLIIGFSDLLIDEYTEIIETLSDLKYFKIEYEILNKVSSEEFKTRNDRLKQKYIYKNIYKLSSEQLEYLYYEMFLEVKVDKEFMINKLNHVKDIDCLYNLIKCMLRKYKKIK